MKVSAGETTKTFPNTDPKRELGSVAIIDGAEWLLVALTAETWVFQPLEKER